MTPNEGGNQSGPIDECPSWGVEDNFAKYTCMPEAELMVLLMQKFKKRDWGN